MTLDAVLLVAPVGLVIAAVIGLAVMALDEALLFVELTDDWGLLVLVVFFVPIGVREANEIERGVGRRRSDERAAASPWRNGCARNVMPSKKKRRDPPMRMRLDSRPSRQRGHDQHRVIGRAQYVTPLDA